MKMSSRTLDMNDSIYKYLLENSLREHPAQTKLRVSTRAHAYGSMQISPEQGQFMALLVKLIGAKKTIEVGVFTGYSSLAVALALPDDGYILACDISHDYTNIAKAHWKEAGVTHKIDLRIDSAIQTLDACIAFGEAESYDFAFIDADKISYDGYYELCLKLIRPGGLIAIDNVLWSGKVVEIAEDTDTSALQQLNKKLLIDERVDISMLPVGDGLTLVRKR
jgi:predicted O-methyltransferase YrrM